MFRHTIQAHSCRKGPACLYSTTAPENSEKLGWVDMAWSEIGGDIQPVVEVAQMGLLVGYG